MAQYTDKDAYLPIDVADENEFGSHDDKGICPCEDGSKALARRWPSTFLFVLALACFCSGLAVATMYMSLPPRSFAQLSESTSVEASGGALKIAPDFGWTRPIRFGVNDEVYADESNRDSDAKWRHLVPPGYGLIELPNVEAESLGLNITRSVPTLNHSTGAYGISWAHGVHCLASLRELFWDQFRQRYEILNPFTPDENRTAHEVSMINHLKHCFNYLREQLECSMDMTVEHRDYEPDDPDHVHISGYGEVHQCKNRDAAMRWIEAHKVVSGLPDGPPIDRHGHVRKPKHGSVHQNHNSH